MPVFLSGTEQASPSGVNHTLLVFEPGQQMQQNTEAFAAQLCSTVGFIVISSQDSGVMPLTPISCLCVSSHPKGEDLVPDQ